MKHTMSRRSLLGMALAAAAPLAAGVRLSAQAKPAMTVYKDVSCGCCEKWVEHMQANGFDVKAVNVDDIDKVKKDRGVPAAAQSCHTGVVGAYVVEGHVPAAAVKKMLAEKPAIAGIAAPGMPMGSPGMEVPSGQKDKFDVVAFDKAGRISVYIKG